MNDFLPGCLVAVIVILMMFYDWSECVMSVPGTTKHSSCNCIDTWQYSCIVLYCIVVRVPACVRL